MVHTRSSASVNTSSDKLERASTIFQLVSYLFLRSVNMEAADQIWKERQRYEDMADEKKKEVPAMLVISYKVSIGESLENMYFIGKIRRYCAECRTWWTYILAYQEFHIQSSPACSRPLYKSSNGRKCPEGHKGANESARTRISDVRIRERIFWPFATRRLW